MGHVAGVAGVRDGPGHGPPVQLLGVVQLVTARDAPRVEVGDPLVVVPDGADHVALHDLHVVDVVEEPHPRRVHLLDHLDPEPGAVALVVLVVDLAVEELHADRDPVLLGRLLHLVEPIHAVLDRVVVGSALAVAEERDQVRHLGLGRLGQGVEEPVHDQVVVRGVVEAVGDVPAHLPSHRADESVLREERPLLLLDQVDRGEADLAHRLAEVGEGDLPVAPAADRLLEPSLLHHAASFRRSHGYGSESGGAGARQGLATRDLGHGFGAPSYPGGADRKRGGTRRGR